MCGRKCVWPHQFGSKTVAQMTRKDKMENEHIPGKSVAQASDKITERRLNWCGRGFQGKGREDDRKQDGKTRADET